MDDEREMRRRARANWPVVRTTLAEQDEAPTVLKATPGERMAMVWDLTLACLAWNTTDEDEPRLQRSVVRIQRVAGWQDLADVEQLERIAK